MLERYFGTAEVTPQNAWMHVYRLLLWIDRTTGLAHCYESDKAQPGRHWYARSLAFHAWVSKQLGTTPAELRHQIDWLFKEGTAQLAAAIASQRAQRLDHASTQRLPYEGMGMPQPGEDPELEAIIANALQPWLMSEPPPETMKPLVEKARAYLMQENKRKNLVGEGFEDVLSAIMRRLPAAAELNVAARVPINEVAGFHSPATGEKVRKVDLVVTGRPGLRTLVSAKWSVRADREEQFAADFESYGRLEKSGHPFDFVLVTSEFDAARLVAACRRRSGITPVFRLVVHVNPDAVLAAYGVDPRRSAAELPELIEQERLISLETWLGRLVR